MTLLISLRNMGLREWRNISRVSTTNGLFKTFSSEANDVAETDDISVDPSKDRRTPIPVETSLRYMESKAYKSAYGDAPVWVQYRRNHKGQIPPRKTRQTCVRKGIISTGNPCPICRDEYLVLHEKNSKLLRQFISEHTGQIISYSKTGLCQKKHKDLLISINRAKDQGIITYDVPFREYDYLEYTSKFSKTAE